VAQFYSTRKRFYAVVVLNTRKDDSLKDRFLSSFVLPDRSSDTPAAVAAQPNENPSEALPATGPPRPARPNGEPLKNEGETDGVNTQPKPPETADSKPQPISKRAPISGGMLNGKAIYLPLPDYPPGNASGVVMVQVVIDEQGSVVEARAVSGPQPLQAGAVNAARLARFSPTTLMGEPVKVSGILSYTFTR
jgi:protein TonB